MSTRTVRINFRYNGTLTNATSAVLSDADSTYGVKRNDNDDLVVNPNTPMTKVATGQYEYTFTEPVTGLAYTAWIKFVYGGNTYYEEVDLAGAESPTTLGMTYASLRREIGRSLGYGRDPSLWIADSDAEVDVLDFLRSGVRRVITPPPIPGEKYAHEWSFLKSTISFSTASPYSTGTVTVASGVVTLADGTFPSWAAQGSIAIPTGTFMVSTRDTDNQLTLVDTSVNAAAGTTYTLGRTIYDMPSDFAEIDGPLIYATGQSVLRNRVDRTSEHQLLMNLAFEITPSYPRIYAIRPKAIDMSAVTAYEMLLCPTPDAVYALFYRYSVAIPALDGTTNTTPPGGDQYGELYLEACLAAAEQKLHDTKGLHSARFIEVLIASVSRDRKALCPDTLGVNTDRSDRPNFDPDDHFFTQPGITRYGSYPP